MLAELRDDNLQLAAHMRETMDCAMSAADVASASLLENWIDETERRVWFLFEASRHGEAGRSRTVRASGHGRRCGIPMYNHERREAGRVLVP